MFVKLDSGQFSLVVFEVERATSTQTKTIDESMGDRRVAGSIRNHTRSEGEVTKQVTIRSKEENKLASDLAKGIKDRVASLTYSEGPFTVVHNDKIAELEAIKRDVLRQCQDYNATAEYTSVVIKAFEVVAMNPVLAETVLRRCVASVTSSLERLADSYDKFTLAIQRGKQDDFTAIRQQLYLDRNRVESALALAHDSETRDLLAGVVGEISARMHSFRFPDLCKQGIAACEATAQVFRTNKPKSLIDSDLPERVITSADMALDEARLLRENLEKFLKQQTSGLAVEMDDPEIRRAKIEARFAKFQDDLAKLATFAQDPGDLDKIQAFGERQSREALAAFNPAPLVALVEAPVVEETVPPLPAMPDANQLLEME